MHDEEQSGLDGMKVLDKEKLVELKSLALLVRGQSGWSETVVPGGPRGVEEGLLGIL